MTAVTPAQRTDSYVSAGKRSKPTPPKMAHISLVAMALASPPMSAGFTGARDFADNKAGLVDDDKQAVALMTPPNSASPDLPAHDVDPDAHSPPPMNIENEMEMGGTGTESMDACRVLDDEWEIPPAPSGTPLSKGALSGLDASAAITPAMLAKHYLPGVMLGNGPRPIRYVMGELTQSVPGFSRIPPAKARRLVVAALESRHGGGLEGNVAFCKTDWGRWDAHIIGSSRDSGMGSFQEGHLSPPRSDRSSYAMSNGDSAVHMPGPRMSSRYRDQHSGASWTASSLREEDELDLDMDVPEHEADKMSLDERREEDDDSSSMNDDTDDDDWAARGPDALRKASLPTPGAPRMNYNSISIHGQGPSRSWSRRPSTFSQPSYHSSSLPYYSNIYSPPMRGIDPATATPEENAAVAALMSLGSM